MLSVRRVVRMKADDQDERMSARCFLVVKRTKSTRRMPWHQTDDEGRGKLR